MKKLFVVMLALAMLLCMCAHAESGKLKEIYMLYEDTDGEQMEQTIEDPALIKELEDMLVKARTSPAKLENCPMNCTIFCTTQADKVYDIAVATDGCPYIQDRATENVYSLEGDLPRFWEIFDEVWAAMGNTVDYAAEW